MNKFEDLMYQSGLTAQGCWDTMDKYDQEAIEKFAQLIVKDCLKVVENHTQGPYDIAMTTKTRNAWNIWIDIKERFEVKCDY